MISARMRRARLAAVIVLGTLLPAAEASGGAPRAGGLLTCDRFGDDATGTAVLIGGIGDDWRSLREWVPLHAKAGLRVCGYSYDSRRVTMSAAARELQRVVEGLPLSESRRLRFTGFSMGGWIAKAALDAMVESATIRRHEEVDLLALGTPWGGFSSANVVWRLRSFPSPAIARGIARLIGRPMAFEVGARSPFVHERRAPLPARVRFLVCEGDADRVARPRTRQERANHAAVLAAATRRVMLAGATHEDLRRPWPACAAALGRAGAATRPRRGGRSGASPGTRRGRARWRAGRLPERRRPSTSGGAARP